MSNYEKARLTNGSTYDLVAGGFRYTDDTLTMIMLPGRKTLDAIDTEFDTPTNVEQIDLLDSAGESLDIRKGYIYLSECKKQKDYVIGREEIDNGVDLDGIPLKEYRDIKGTIVMVTLKKSDVRKELNSVKETVDMLVVASLEV